MGIDCCLDCIGKVKNTEELKNVGDFDERMRILHNAFVIRDMIMKEMNVLLFDDLYRSGATLNEVSRLLQEEGGVRRVYVLTLTKTRVKR